jgi:predicted CoA-binding protein
MQDITELLEMPDTTVAVVGATDNPEKYGNVIYKDLKRKGFTVYPVNSSRETVDGDPAFKSLGDIPEQPTIVNIVVPPDTAYRILEQCKKLGLQNVWLQPGAESARVLNYLQENSFNYLANACIMVQSRLRN